MGSVYHKLKTTLLKICKKILNMLRRAVYKVIFINFPVRNKVVLFCSYQGKNYSCNPKAIYEAMKQMDRFQDFKLVWALKAGAYNVGYRGSSVKYGSLRYHYYLSIAKYWVFNSKMPGYYIKKKEQIYLQTWHGTPLKRLAKDIEVGANAKFYRSGMTKEEMVKTYEQDSSRYNYLISPNKFSTEAFKSAFNIKDNIILETGYPRNDMLVKAESKYITAIKKRLKLPEDKIIVLYAPTWRDDNYDRKGYVFELKVDFHKWQKALGAKYFILYKPHYLIYNTSNLSIPPNFALDCSGYEEINELYLISDILITDYSSVFFDYGILKRPILFYMYDLEAYKNNLRGFYLDIYKDLPGPIIEKEEELLDKIMKVHRVRENFEDRYNSFYNRFCGLNDGCACERVIDILFGNWNI